MDHWKLGYNGGGVTNHAHYDDTEREIILEERQSGAANQATLDEAANFRRAEAEGGKRHQQGVKAASIPITMWWEWKTEWRQHCKDLCTWQTYLLKRINDAEYKKLRTTNQKLPTRYIREQSREH